MFFLFFSDIAWSTTNFFFNTSEPTVVTRAIIPTTRKVVTVDLATCSKCGGCLEVAPQIFRFSESGGYIEVCDLDLYDESIVDEAIKFCPENSIEWEHLP